MKPRRFEMGASGLGSDDFLRELGYTVTRGGRGNAGYRVVGPKGGRPRDLNQRQLITLLDEERKKVGLEPIIRGKD